MGSKDNSSYDDAVMGTVFGSLSAIGSLLILITFMKESSMDRPIFYRMTMLTLSDFAVSIKFLTGSIYGMIVDVSKVPSNYCILMGMIDQFFSLAVWVWYLVICLYVIDAMKDSIPCFPKKIYQQHMLVCTYASVCTLFPVFIDANAYGISVYNFDCWVKGKWIWIFYATTLICAIVFAKLTFEMFACKQIVAVQLYFASRSVWRVFFFLALYLGIQLLSSLSTMVSYVSNTSGFVDSGTDPLQTASFVVYNLRGFIMAIVWFAAPKCLDYVCAGCAEGHSDHHSADSNLHREAFSRFSRLSGTEIEDNVDIHGNFSNRRISVITDVNNSNNNKTNHIVIESVITTSDSQSTDNSISGGYQSAGSFKTPSFGISNSFGTSNITLDSLSRGNSFASLLQGDSLIIDNAKSNKPHPLKLGILHSNSEAAYLGSAIHENKYGFYRGVFAEEDHNFSNR
jgi:hypothetical protein